MSSQTLNILHVEDDTVDAMVVQRALGKSNIVHSYTHANNGLEAIDKLRGTGGQQKMGVVPHIIILDINMPKMNGLEFLKELRNDENLKNISVFVLTTSNDEHDKKTAYQYNVAGYILKPVSLENMVSTFTILKDYWALCVYP
jgi:CheY-like chemotaxis protein